MKVAIMQPYFFPYIGYFQLINSVDKFVIYDDVSFIKGGWINRNNILINNNKQLFTIPLSNISSFNTIKNTTIDKKNYPIWLKKFEKTIYSSYKKAPYYEKIESLIFDVLKTQVESISDLNRDLLIKISEYLNIKTEFVNHSEVYNNSSKKGEERIIDICLQESAKTYINPIGGIELYSKDNFNKNGLELKFLKSKNIEYKQFNNEFIPWLSIIDVLMFNSIEDIQKMLNEYEFI
ncbi:WbqC family protein [bacterium]|nr:WbqC family protein [bacterium]